MKASTVIEYEAVEITTIMIAQAKEHSKIGAGSATVVVFDSEGNPVDKPAIRITFHQTGTK